MSPEEKKILQYIFKNPIRAFILYFKNPYLNRYWILKVHITLWFFACLMQVLKNIFLYIDVWLVAKKPFFSSSLLFDNFLAILFYPVLGIAIYQFDILRLFYKKPDRVKGELERPLNLLLLSFLPVSFTSTLWFLPNLPRLIVLSIAFLYSVYISYIAMVSFSKINFWDFVGFLFVCIIYSMLFIFVFSFLFFLYKNFDFLVFYLKSI